MLYDSYGTIVIRGGLALTLYTSAVIAEIVRGGLNSIAEGQFESRQIPGVYADPDIDLYRAASMF